MASSRKTSSQPTGSSADAVVTKALSRMASRLDLSQGAVADVIGVSPSTVTRLFRGDAKLAVDAKEGQLALLLLRVFRSLDALVGADKAALRHWFHKPNLHLGGVPAELVKTPQGLVHVADYLDAMRGTL